MRAASYTAAVMLRPSTKIPSEIAARLSERRLQTARSELTSLPEWGVAATSMRPIPPAPWLPRRTVDYDYECAT